MWSVIAAVYGNPSDNEPHLVSHYRQWESVFNTDGIQIPMELKDVPKFERLNDISVSVYGYKKAKKNSDGLKTEEGFVYALQVVREVRAKHVNLLLITNDDTNHYCLIRNFSRLVRSQVIII